MDLTTATKTKALVIQGVRMIAAHCDGAIMDDRVGFNGRDSTWGNAIAGTPDDRWTWKMVTNAYKMLRTYRNTQLPPGFYDAIPVPTPLDSATAAALAPAPKGSRAPFQGTVPVRRIATLAGQSVRFTFGTNDPSFSVILNAVRGLPNRRFDGASKSWSVPLATHTAIAILDFLRAYDFEYAAEIEDQIDALTLTASANIESSRAASSTFEVTGLGGELRPFQKAGVEYIVRNRRVLVCDEMGLGKTVQALAALQALNAFPAVIVTPASVKLNWARETAKWLPGRTIEVLNGKEGAYTADVVIVNYDMLKKHIEQLVARKFAAGVADEIHYCKNYKALRTGHVKRLFGTVDVRIGLTGTPVLNRPAEIISPLTIIDRLKEAGGFSTVYYHHANAQSNGYGMTFGEPKDLEGLNSKLRASCYIRREKAQVLTELPAKTTARVAVELSDPKKYAKAERDLAAWAASAPPDSAAHLVQLTALRKLTALLKLDSVKEWVENFLDSGEKLVLFAHHKEVQQALTEAFPNAAAITGDMTPEIRQANVDRFQRDPACRLIVCSIMAAAEGLTLTAASNVAFVEWPWNPGKKQQAEDRVHRIGQRNAVTVWDLAAAGTVDDDMLDLIETKGVVVKALATGEGTSDAKLLGSLLQRIAERSQKK